MESSFGRLVYASIRHMSEIETKNFAPVPHHTHTHSSLVFTLHPIQPAQPEEQAFNPTNLFGLALQPNRPIDSDKCPLDQRPCRSLVFAADGTRALLTSIIIIILCNQRRAESEICFQTRSCQIASLLPLTFLQIP
ncbi:unnamed protein product [Periconia digitata]|uniref:Uncharacterized protein n=1 Tax=Periconia digitata TaxID=1303443 RepID=A0A9W4UUM4_9PLEO|nr:unnamed protein product [Periconia digitata]